MIEHNERSLDLHGMTRDDAKKAFIEFYNGAVLGSGGRAIRLDIVHGYGSTGVGGVIRGWLRGYLERHPTYLEYKPGEEMDGNKGHTFVMPLKELPSMGQDLTEEIWAYCVNPRAQSKIIGKFRRYGDAEVMRVIKLMEKQGRLRASTHGPARTYQAA